jgi:hypothetical protein
MKNEKQLDAALESSLEADAEFRHWFLSQTKTGNSFKELVLLRADYPWGKFRAILPNPLTGAIEVVVREAETDILLVIERDDGKRIGFHIENKLASGSFTPHQPEMYAVRAEAWRKNSDYGNYDEWETVLIAPQAFFEKFKSDASKFISFISHEELAKRIFSFAGTGASEA